MSFSNFPHQLVLFPWMADLTINCMPYLAYTLENSFHGLAIKPQ